MRGKKVYGESRTDSCPFCGKQATITNEVGLLVCSDHKSGSLPDIRCTCGEYLDIKKGKFGPFFTCFNCGAISFAKGMEIMNMAIKKKNKKKGDYVNGEFIVSIDDL